MTTIPSPFRISSHASHSAFTDLIAFNNAFYCVYRQATNHMSGDGRIEITRLDSQLRITGRNRLTLNGTDLRDPKLSIGPNNTLYLVAYAKTTSGEMPRRISMVSWFSSDGHSWSSPHRFGDQGWWMWKHQWYQGEAYSLAYKRAAQRLDLYQGHPRKTMNRRVTGILSLSKHGLGYPNETDFHIDKQGVIRALCRRDADNFSAQLGLSMPPYRYWRWFDLGIYIGGPVMKPLQGNDYLVAGRTWTGKKMLNRVWKLTFEQNQPVLTTICDLPSQGDNSYPGMVIGKDNVVISYYSSHIDNEARVYIANLPRDTIPTSA